MQGGGSDRSKESVGQSLPVNQVVGVEDDAADDRTACSQGGIRVGHPSSCYVVARDPRRPIAH